MADYDVSLEISGPTAMWTRPDTGDAPVSYQAPTYSAVKGIFESILWLKTAEVVPVKVEICAPIVFHHYFTNYGGPLRKRKVLANNSSFQFLATVLINVCYRLYATVAGDRKGEQMIKTNPLERKTTNSAHAYHAMFNRRLQRGAFYSTPCLGWKEFAPDYVGPFRAQTRVQTDIDVAIPSMLRTCFPDGKDSAWRPIFDRDQRITEGALTYAQ